MKIIYGITKSNFGGAQRYVFDLARHAKAAGHDVSVLCGGEGLLVERLRAEDIRVIPLPHLKRDISLLDELRSFYFIYRTLLSERPDVFHTNSSKMGGLGNLAAQLAGVSHIIFTGHGWAFNESWRPWWQKSLIRLFAWLTIILSDKTVSVSESAAFQISHWPLLSDKIKVIRNGIDPFSLLPREEARNTLGAGDQDLLVGAVAELHPVKGLDVLLEAWQKLSKQKPEAKLMIIGDGEERENLEEEIQALGISGSVMMKGFVSNASKYLKAFDIFVLPSRSENLPYAVLEAGLAGVPVIATRVGGIPEVVENGASGILVERENTEELFSSILLLSNDEGLRNRLGESLREMVLEQFTADKMASDTMELYERS